MGSNGRKIVVEKFSWGRVARDITEVFDEIIKV
jgi:glycosyltransferase involved in cell wall biosynthesis